MRKGNCGEENDLHISNKAAEFLEFLSPFSYISVDVYIKCVSLQLFMSFKMGTKLFPKSVKEYSTLGGIS